MKDGGFNVVTDSKIRNTSFLFNFYLISTFFAKCPFCFLFRNSVPIFFLLPYSHFLSCF
jgi:hypothetical protein